MLLDTRVCLESEIFTIAISPIYIWRDTSEINQLIYYIHDRLPLRRLVADITGWRSYTFTLKGFQDDFNRLSQELNYYCQNNIRFLFEIDPLKKNIKINYMYIITEAEIEFA